MVVVDRVRGNEGDTVEFAGRWSERINSGLVAGPCLGHERSRACAAANDRGRRTRESLAIEADALLTSQSATAALERVLDVGPSPD